MNKQVVVVLAALALTGCVSGDVSQYSPAVGQEAIVRDGVPAIVSMKAHSVVMVRQATRKRAVGSRPAYVVAILNTDAQPVTFRFSDIQVAQMRGAHVAKPLKTFSYEELVREERNLQVLSAILVGVAAGANSAAAANSGHYSASGTVSGPYGTSHVTVQGYDAAAANIASMNASLQNQAMVSNAVEAGRRNLDALETTIIKDNTILPGEWYGGQVQFDQPTGTPPLSYRIALTVGGDVHEFDVTQVKAGS